MPDAQPAISPAPKFQRRATGTDTVIVACSIPNGYVLQVYDIEKQTQYDRNTGRSFEENIATPAERWTLYGSALDYQRLAAGNVPDYRLIKGLTPNAGYALTPGVPRDFWEKWKSQNERNPVLVNRMVYAHSTEDAAVGQAREYKELRSGLEGLNQAGDYRVPSGRNIRKYSPNDNRTTPDQRDLAEAAE